MLIKKVYKVQKSILILGLLLLGIFYPEFMFQTISPTASSTINNNVVPAQQSSFFSGIKNSIGSAFDTLDNATGGQLQMLKVLQPVGLFLFNLPTTLLNSFLKNDYLSNKFTVMNEDLDDAQMNYGVEYDFGFTGAGDINKPFLFEIVNGQFMFRSIKAKFLPEVFFIRNDDGTVREEKRFNFKNSQMSIFMPAIFKSISPNHGLKVWNFINRLFTPYPQDVFTIKLLSLMMASGNNVRVGSGYPRPEHILFELQVLFSRLSKTPNIEATQSNHPPGTYSRYWDPKKIVFFDALDFNKLVESLPEGFRDYINRVTLSITEGERQAFLDLQNQTLLKGQVLYGNLVSLNDYESKTKLIFEQILPYAKSGQITKTEFNLLIYGIKRHFLERLGHLQGFLLMPADLGLVAVNSFAQGAVEVGIDLDASTMPVNLNDPSIEDLREVVGNLNGEKIQTLLKPRYDKLKLLAKELENLLVVKPLLVNDVGYFQNMPAVLDQELIKLKEIADRLNNLSLLQTGSAGTSSALEQNAKGFLGVYDDLRTLFFDLMNQKNRMFYTAAWGNQQPIALLEYLKIKFFDFKRLNFAKFDGDTGYFKDNSTLDTFDAVMHGIAIILRAKKDLMIAESFFKNDTKGQYMLTSANERKLIRGSEIYQTLYEKPLLIKNTFVDQLFKLEEQASKSSLLSSATKDQAYIRNKAKLLEQIASAEQQFSDLNNEYQYYLRQFRLDRRDKSGNIPTKTFDVSILTSVARSQEQLAQDDIKTAAESLILEYSLSGKTALVRADLLLPKKKLEQLLAKFQDNTMVLTQEKTMTDKQAVLAKYQADLQELNTLLTKSQADLTSLGQISTGSSAQTALQTQIDQFKVAIAERNKLIVTTQSEIKAIQDNLAGLKAKADACQAALALIKTLVVKQDLADSSVADIINKNPALSAVKNDLDSVVLQDNQFLLTVIKAKELIQAKTLLGTVSNTPAATNQIVAEDVLSFNSTLVELFTKKIETALAITAENNLDEAIKKAKLEIINTAKTLMTAELNYDSIEAKFIADLKAVSQPLVLAAPTGLLAGVMKSLTYGLAQILSSSIGFSFFKFLKQKLIPEWKNSLSGGLAGQSIVNFEQVDAVDALLAANRTTGDAQTTVVSPEDVALRTELNSTITLLQQALLNKTIWERNLWDWPGLKNPASLPLEGSKRLYLLGETMVALMQKQRRQLLLEDEIYTLTQGFIYLVRQAFGQAINDPGPLLNFIDTWLRKITLGAAAQNASDLNVLNNLKQLWRWLGAALPQLFVYANFFAKAGIYSSINDFLVKEFSDLFLRSMLSRMSQEVYIGQAFLDPILINSLGIDINSLIKNSVDEQKRMFDLAIANYASEFENAGLKLNITLQQKAERLTASLDTLNEGLSQLNNAGSQGLVDTEAMLNQQAALINKTLVKPVISGQAIDSYFNNLAKTAASTTAPMLDPNAVINDEFGGVASVNNTITSQSLSSSATQLSNAVTQPVINATQTTATQLLSSGTTAVNTTLNNTGQTLNTANQVVSATSQNIANPTTAQASTTAQSTAVPTQPIATSNTTTSSTTLTAQVR